MAKKILNPAKRLDIAKHLWKWDPHPTQKEWLIDTHQIKVAACGRRWGKTEAAAVDIATSAITDRGSIQMIVAPTYDQSKLISGTIERLLLSNPITAKHSRITKSPYTEIRLYGSRIMARTADEDGRNLRGYSADRVIVDEAAYVNDCVVEEVIGPMLADKNGRLMMISTPAGKNHFYRMFMRGSDGLDARCGSFRFPSAANPHINSEYIEYQRQILAPRRFKVEYEADFVDDETSVFPWSDIQSAIDNTKSNQSHGKPVYVAGIDWARYSDYTAVVLLEVLPPDAGRGVRYKVASVDRFNKLEWHEQVKRASDLLNAYGVSGIAADQTSVGDPVLEMLKNYIWDNLRMHADVEGVVFTNQSKREMIDNLAIRLARRELKFPDIDQLVNELKYYDYELTPSGNVRTAARRGGHDDCVCALALALKIAPRYAYFNTSATSGNSRRSSAEWDVDPNIPFHSLL